MEITISKRIGLRDRTVFKDGEPVAIIFKNTVKSGYVFQFSFGQKIYWTSHGTPTHNGGAVSVHLKTLKEVPEFVKDVYQKLAEVFVM